MNTGGSITINGKTYNGNRIVVTNGHVVIDGVDATPDAKVVNIVVNGDIQSINADSCQSIHVNGNVGEVSSQSGDIQCGNVNGSVQTMSGDIKCGHVSGNAKTMSGDILPRNRG